MATEENTPPAGEGKLLIEMGGVIYECRIAAEAVAAGVERLGAHSDLPPVVSAELSILAKLAKETVEVLRSLQDMAWRGLGVAGQT
jgi:hypothetical protein